MLRGATDRGMAGRSNGVTATDRKRHSVLVAFFFSLFPGLGAVYNGQNIKALLHFTLIAGAWTLADLFAATLESIFSLVGVATYLYSIHDACQSARRANAGSDLVQEEERIRSVLRKRTDIAGLGLILLGGMVVLNSLVPSLFNRFWPLILVLMGGRLVWSWRRRPE
jgi:TM2 domain-containing membrane protein YozV